MNKKTFTIDIILITIIAAIFAMSFNYNFFILWFISSLVVTLFNATVWKVK